MKLLLRFYKYALNVCCHILKSHYLKKTILFFNIAYCVQVTRWTQKVCIFLLFIIFYLTRSENVVLKDVSVIQVGMFIIIIYIYFLSCPPSPCFMSGDDRHVFCVKCLQGELEVEPFPLLYGCWWSCCGFKSLLHNFL